MINGKTAVVRNFSNQQVVLNQINNSAETPFVWNIDPWNITLPYTMQPGDSLNLTIKIAVQALQATNIPCDTLFVNTETTNNHVMVCADPFLLTKINTSKSEPEVQVYPNPMSSITTFSLNNQSSSEVSIEIYSMQGKLVAVPLKEKMAKGNHTVVWEGNGLQGEKFSPGIYLYRITRGDNVSTGKISILY
jgi:hypothetical protein